MTDHEAAVRQAVDQLVAVLLAAARDGGAPIADAPDRLYDLATAMDLLSIGRSRLYSEMDAGRIRSLKSGRRRLIPSSAIRDYIESGRVERQATR